MTRSSSFHTVYSFSSIQLMRFFLRTAYGDSNRSYGSSGDDLPFQGVCQGNGAGPALWLAVSITLVNLLHSHGHLATFQSPISGQSISITGLLYVDDCDLVAYSPPHPTGPVSTIGKLQRNITLWQGSLRATGGNLSLKKCTWSILAMCKQGHKWRPIQSARYRDSYRFRILSRQVSTSAVLNIPMVSK